MDQAFGQWLARPFAGQMAVVAARAFREVAVTFQFAPAGSRARCDKVIGRSHARIDHRCPGRRCGGPALQGATTRTSRSPGLPPRHCRTTRGSSHCRGDHQTPSRACWRSNSAVSGAKPLGNIASLIFHRALVADQPMSIVNESKETACGRKSSSSNVRISVLDIGLAVGEPARSTNCCS